MVQVTNFLLRWLFLCRLVDDRAEVQTWPYRRPGYYEHPPQQHQQQQPQIQHHDQYQQHNEHPPSQQQQQHTNDNNNIHQDDTMDIPTYRESVIRSLTSYPPGSSERLHRLEELRLQTVHEFAKQLVHADEVIRFGILISNEKHTGDDVKGDTDSNAGEKSRNGDSSASRSDVDTTIQDELQQFMKQHQHSPISDHDRQSHNMRHHFFGHRNDHPAIEDTKSESTSSTLDNPLQSQTPEQISSSLSSAHKLLNEAREMLPQLVSTVLHSPPALLPETIFPIDPISSLRSLLIHRCQTNPSLGIELCWLLEAEVGRKWKALFEHRQQTGKRLILIVQADIAAAIASVGAEKASAFNLLQDAEMATAFGVERTMETHYNGYGQQQQQQYGGGDNSYHHQQYNQQYHPSISSSTASANAARPPQSISDLRCRHFGDSMHFIDRLTQIALDLRHVPPIHRQGHLQHRLSELNTRLCRRMISRGGISIDVEEYDVNNHHHQYQQQHQQEYYHEMGSNAHNMPPQPPVWREEDVREDMIQHSVHFPMEPQSVRWPGCSIPTSGDTDDTDTSSSTISDFEHPLPHNGVVRALRILPNNCRVLDSAQRCPFLVRMEVVETGLDANDARLYACNVPKGGVGVTVQESMGSHRPYSGGFDPCEIPPELIQRQPQYNDDSSIRQSQEIQRSQTNDISTAGTKNRAVSFRGGYQQGDGYYPSDAYGMVPDAFDMVREQYYEDLHHDLREQRENEYNSPSGPSITAGNQLSTGSVLLDKVFGRPWSVECENIRQQSPFSNIKGWKLASFIIKAGEDIRKEALVMQIMSKLWTWFQEEIPPHLRPFLRPYTIMCVGGDAGIVECLPDVKSVSEVKKETDGFTSLRNFFERAYGPPVHPPYRPDYQHQQQFGTVSFEKARDNFLRSLVGYSVVCYILQIKDRHNANVLMDREGHIMVSF